MGNCKSSNDKVSKDPDKSIEHEKWNDNKVDDMRKKRGNPSYARTNSKESVGISGSRPSTRGAPTLGSASCLARSYDDEAIDRMRFQMNNDSEAFLLNNILLSVQFFENFESEMSNLNSNTLSEREHRIDEAMVKHHKHVFFADRLQECVHEHVRFLRSKGQQEALSSPRLFVIYDNIEASEPGDTSDYSEVLDAPFYKLVIEDCKEMGYVQLKKLEVIENNAMQNEIEICESKKTRISGDSVYTESIIESNDSEDGEFAKKGNELLHEIKSRLDDHKVIDKSYTSNITKLSATGGDMSGRRYSGPIKQPKSNKNALRKLSVMFEDKFEKRSSDNDIKIAKPVLKNRDKKQVGKIYDNGQINEDEETDLGYRSNSSRNNENSGTESDYGYATITESTTPKRVVLSLQSNLSATSGILPKECWATLKVRALEQFNNDEDDDADSTSRTIIKEITTMQLYNTHYYLNSLGFMTNFVDSFMIKLGNALDFTNESVNNALTQGATVYCDSTITGKKLLHKVIPAIIGSWPNAANHWIIRERKVIINPRTNLNYQWPTRNMVRKAINFGCLLIPVGFRPKRGPNINQRYQWKIVFPAAERYLENCLAHSHIRCYLFALALYKAFMEIDSCKTGIDSRHIKNHLFWQCEDNLAMWPEDRLGESLRIFLRRFYEHFGRARLPNYFIQSCNDFKGIPTPLLLKLQRRLHDIIQSPVMHVLSSIEQLKYVSKDFYPSLDVHRLYILLTSNNPLRLANPNLTPGIRSISSSESESDDTNNAWDKAKLQDKSYQWKVARRKAQEKRKASVSAKKNKTSTRCTIDKNIIIPPKLEIERRRLVLEFFIPHFINMAKCSEKFEATKQAVIYLEQALRLSTLLLEEPGGDNTANDYIDTIQSCLTECHRSLINESGYKIPNRNETKLKEPFPFSEPRSPPKQHRTFSNVLPQNSPTDMSRNTELTFVNVELEPSTSGYNTRNNAKLTDTTVDTEEDSNL